MSFWVGGGEFPLNLKSEESIRVRRAYPAHIEERDGERDRLGTLSFSEMGQWGPIL